MPRHHHLSQSCQSNDVQAMRAALQPLVGSIDVELMRAANLRATGGSNASPAEVARWLWSEIERRR